jgi:hypothetical protein
MEKSLYPSLKQPSQLLIAKLLTGYSEILIYMDTIGVTFLLMDEWNSRNVYNFFGVIIFVKTNLTISFVKASIRVTKKIMMSKLKLVLTVYESQKNT